MGFSCKFEGLVLPLGKTNAIEWEWPNVIRLILYLIGLGWLFLAVGVISDIFMTAIEKVTSLKKRVTDKETGKTRTVYVWNMTVANLTLMALGSSAPEILLSLIEITTGDFILGPLGAGTIVGSAAFNLLIISAACVCALPDGECRKINDIPVYVVTATCSVFAYLWLMFILMVTSPDVCEIWEAVLTLLFCPMLVFVAYLADRGYFTPKSSATAYEADKPLQVSAEDCTDEELAQIEADIREQYGKDITDEQVKKMMRVQCQPRRSRAQYRHISHQALGGSHKAKEIIAEGPAEHMISDAVAATDEVDAEKEARTVRLSFATDHYAVLENCGTAKLKLVRTGPTGCKASVRYKTREDTAKAGSDFVAVDGTLVFNEGETEKEIEITVLDDITLEEDEDFYVDLSDPSCEDGASCLSGLGDAPIAKVTIFDDDLPGKLRFKTETFETSEGAKGCELELTVDRYDGATGTVSCAYRLEGMGAKDGVKAVAGIDYEDVSGRLEFESTVQSQVIRIPIKPLTRRRDCAFNIIIDDAQGGVKFDETTDGNEDSCICYVVIKATTSENNTFAIIREQIQSANARMGARSWKQQFYDAIFTIGDPDDDDGDGAQQEGEDGKPIEPPEPPSKIDVFLHVVTVPWKLLFAFVPPTTYCGGWACFFGALVMIAVVTALVGDMANLVGCCFDILPETGAITFVALGTSLPDTFASMTAAKMDPYADASIGNVTGSNSVNVFLGIGLAWCVAAFYWETQKPNADWRKALSHLTPDQQTNVMKVVDAKGGNAVFIAPAGSLWFNLMVFCVNAACAIGHLFSRRKFWGGELGGKKWGFMGQYFSAAFLGFQWFLYVGVSIIFARLQDDPVTYGKMAERA